MKKPKPTGVCNVCHALTTHHDWINHRCDHVVYGRRCNGTFRSALTDLWEECESCHGTGMVGTVLCGECAGFDWKLHG